MKGWAWPHVTHQAPSAWTPSPAPGAPNLSLGENGGDSGSTRESAVSRTRSPISSGENTKETCFWAICDNYTTLCTDVKHKFSFSFLGFAFLHLPLSPLDLKLCRAAQRRRCKMSKLLPYHLHSLLPAMLFSCYLNIPVFLSAHPYPFRHSKVCVRARACGTVDALLLCPLSTVCDFTSSEALPHTTGQRKLLT